ncbi:MAG TPA: hypothetical protein VL326_10710 [Kofleriaceae bacterium]|nr:hypothetical protein [Kofleriaceae bacterium]
MANRAAKQNPALHALSAIVGEWTTSGSHPLVPGVTLHGRTSFLWIEGGAFLRMESELDDRRFPNGIAIIGSDDNAGTLYMLYFDERGVSRKYNVEVDEDEQGWRWWRDDPKLAQRFKVTIEDGGNKMVGKGEMAKDGGEWEGDLDLTYTRLDKSGPT